MPFVRPVLPFGTAVSRPCLPRGAPCGGRGPPGGQTRFHTPIHEHARRRAPCRECGDCRESARSGQAGAGCGPPLAFPAPLLFSLKSTVAFSPRLSFLCWSPYSAPSLSRMVCMSPCHVQRARGASALPTRPGSSARASPPPRGLGSPGRPPHSQPGAGPSSLWPFLTLK